MSVPAVRTATISDAKAIARIHVMTWQYAYRGQLPDSYLDSLSIEQRLAVWREKLAEHHYPTNTLVGLFDVQVAGFCSIEKSRDTDAKKSVGELYALYIDPCFMNQGMGSALMQRGLDYLKTAGFTAASLWVLTTNTKSRTFYEHKGWRPDGKTKTEQRNGVELQETRYVIDLV